MRAAASLGSPLNLPLFSLELRHQIGLQLGCNLANSKRRKGISDDIKKNQARTLSLYVRVIKARAKELFHRVLLHISQEYLSCHFVLCPLFFLY